MYRFVLTLFLVSYLISNGHAKVTKVTCGATTSAKEIQMLTPANPPRNCAYHIKAYSKHVCQLRIDFTWLLAPPTVPSASNDLKYVQCIDDYFEVNDLRLCGKDSKQHIYVPFNRTDGLTQIDLEIALALRIGNHGLPTPMWNIQVTQLECPSGSALRSADFEEPTALVAEGRASSIKHGFFVAPPGCLQYFPEPAGTITSFNYNSGKGIYLGNMNYAICFRRDEDTTGLELKAKLFKVAAESNEKAQDTDDYCYPQLQQAGFSDDYLMVPQSNLIKTGRRATYFCGSSLQANTLISSNPGPLVALFNSDQIYLEGKETGFSLSYKILES